jgi:hypothetical protein
MGFHHHYLPVTGLGSNQVEATWVYLQNTIQGQLRIDSLSRITQDCYRIRDSRLLPRYTVSKLKLLMIMVCQSQVNRKNLQRNWVAEFVEIHTPSLMCVGILLPGENAGSW